MSNVDGPARRGMALRRQISRLLVRLGFREEAFLIVLAGIIGILTGVGSVGFTKLIALSHDLCYGGGTQKGVYAGRGLFLVVLPAGGALLVGLITYFFAREAKGHGVPEVMDAIARRDGLIRPRVALAKAIASALTIGSGGSAGTEGPIIQIGAAIGSSTGKYFQVVKHNLPEIPVFGVVVFSKDDPIAKLTLKKPIVPATHMSSLPIRLKEHYLAKERIEMKAAVAVERLLFDR